MIMTLPNSWRRQFLPVRKKMYHYGRRTNRYTQRPYRIWAAAILTCNYDNTAKSFQRIITTQEYLNKTCGVRRYFTCKLQWLFILYFINGSLKVTVSGFKLYGLWRQRNKDYWIHNWQVCLPPMSGRDEVQAYRDWGKKSGWLTSGRKLEMERPLYDKGQSHNRLRRYRKLHMKRADQFFPLHNLVSRVVLKSCLISLFTSV